MAANETKTDTELESVALRIYVERVSMRSASFGSDQIAAASFRDAEAFLRIRDKVRNKELEPSSREIGTQLSDASAPNLSPLHPLNLISKRFGDKDLRRVKQINEWLSKNHPAQDAPIEEFVDRFEKAFRDLPWKQATAGETLAVINTARAVFPAYCGGN